MSKLVRSFVGFLLLLTSFAGFTPANAETIESISLFDIRIDIAETGVMTFTERIVYNFGDLDRHGIFRFVPVEDAVEDGSARIYDVDLLGVAMNGQAVPVEEYIENGYVVYKIGDPNSTLSGTQIYEIQYQVTGGLHPLTEAEAIAPATSGDIEFYWDVVGDGWEIPIENVFVSVFPPAGAIAGECFPVSGQECDFDLATAEATDLSAYEPLTLAITYPQSAFSAEIVETIRPPWATEFKSSLPFGVAFAVLILGFLGWMIRRVRGTIKPQKILEFVRFEIPEGLKPAEVAAALDGAFEAKDLTATLLDLATRGFVKLETIDRKIQITRLATPTNAHLSTWERELLSAIFKKGDVAQLDKYEKRIEKAVAAAKSDILSEAASSGRRPTNLNSKKVRFIVLAVVFGVLLIPAMISMVAPKVFGLVLPGVLTGLVVSLIGIFATPQQHTERSAEFVGAALGLKRALDTEAAEDRRLYAQESGLDEAKIFATFLPFAVIFGLEKAWIAAHPMITAAALGGYGIYVSDFNDLDSTISSITSSATSTMTNPASSSGGSAGGGGGGGGGGSW